MLISKYMTDRNTAVLLVNLGSPKSPNEEDVAPFLKEFLSDRRVVEVNRLVWWAILNGIIIPKRKSFSASLYKRIWTEEGSPLIVNTEKLAEAIQNEFKSKAPNVTVLAAMRYGEPNVKEVFRDLHEKKGFDEILVVPLFPLYSATTTATIMDMVAESLLQMRSQPQVGFLRDYHTEEGYIKSLADSVRELWQQKGALGKADKLVLSFHGVPKAYCEKGDPYLSQVKETAQLLKEELALNEDQLVVTFQSRFGKDPWLEPYTQPTLIEMAKAGVKRVDILCPGFAVDCLETLDEINNLARKAYLDNGGEQFNYVPCLNYSEDWVKRFSQILADKLI